MEVSAEAKRIMVVALGKLYSSRLQRGGLRLHRSLLLTRVMKSARDIYHAALATTDVAASECERRRTPETTAGPDGGKPELEAFRSPAPGTEEVAGAPAELRRLRPRSGAGNKENLNPNDPGQQSRKRRAKAAAEPDFLPRKKAKLEQRPGPPQQLVVTSALMDYVHCGGELVTHPAPAMPLQRAVAAC
ncbi:immediate early response gene 2 protein [Brachionichthys hirsutus]|uniref:immediate early response gene 2 protein n=1 Tax=Brachionichthys hirsutus TaxID=412623 RepID=UPI0036051FF6